MARSRLLHDERGTSVTEFVVIAPLFFALFFAILEFGLAFYWAQGLEKAAQLGARLAVVSDPLVALPATNVRSGAAMFGQLCSSTPDPCPNFGQLVYTCTGGGCSGNAIVGRMREIFPPLNSSGTITIAYEYARLGFVGGPTAPSVTVTISGVPPPFGALNVVFPIFFGGDLGADILPDIRATLTGEDLRT